VPFDPSLDVSATLSEDDRTVAIFAVNHTTQVEKRTIDLQALASLAGEADTWILADTATAGERDAINSWHEPERIRVAPGKAALAGPKLVYAFPPLSLTVLKIRPGKE
jgi:alpha-L-arabinofuranosidase